MGRRPLKLVGGMGRPGSTRSGETGLPVAVVMMFALIVSSRGVLAAEREDEHESETEHVAASIDEPSILLVRDTAVQAELKLTEEQRERIGEVTGPVDGPLWAMRDLPPEEGGEKLAALLADLRRELEAILKPHQQRRLDQIVLQARGVSAVRDDETAAKLPLSDPQRKRVRDIIAETRARMISLQKLAAEEPARKETVKKGLEQLNVRQTDGVLAVLTDVQRRRLTAMMGAPFDLSRIKPIALRAPELQKAAAWINSEPLTLEKLRGRVVVINFYTFGCINCIRNYPVYKRWQASYADKPVTLIGIHTPETQGERDLGAVRRKAEEAGFKYPILVDTGMENWKAWTNRVWPSVYVVDKQGLVRYWWYGELNSDKINGEQFMQTRIDELLAEK